LRDQKLVATDTHLSGSALLVAPIANSTYCDHA